MLGCAKMSVMATGFESISLTRRWKSTSCRDVAPRSKKLSRAPMFSRPSTFSARAASFVSPPPSGGVKTAALTPASARDTSFLRSTLPLDVSGMAGRVRMVCGTMYPGSHCERSPRIFSGSAVPDPGAFSPRDSYMASVNFQFFPRSTAPPMRQCRQR